MLAICNRAFRGWIESNKLRLAVSAQSGFVIGFELVLARLQYRTIDRILLIRII
jgi:hypothetical protein